MICQVCRAREDARDEVLELRLKLKELELESRKKGLEDSEENWRQRLGEQLDTVEHLQQAKLICQSSSRTLSTRERHFFTIELEFKQRDNLLQNENKKLS